MTTENEQPKSAEEIRPINIKILVAENISKGLAEFIKDDEIQEFYEELIVDTVLHFLSLRESSAQKRIKELEEEVVELSVEANDLACKLEDYDNVDAEESKHLWNKAVQECIDELQNRIDVLSGSRSDYDNKERSGLQSMRDKLKLKKR